MAVIKINFVFFKFVRIYDIRLDMLIGLGNCKSKSKNCTKN